MKNMVYEICRNISFSLCGSPVYEKGNNSTFRITSIECDLIGITYFGVCASTHLSQCISLCQLRRKISGLQLANGV